MADKQTVIPILGMHRSGTSMLTHMLSHMGVELGGPLQPPSFDNPKGFWENRFFQAANIRLLGQAGCDVDGFAAPDKLRQTAAVLAATDPQGEAFEATAAYIEQTFTGSHWGWKDPRTTVTLPYWQACFSRLGIDDVRPIVILRHPDACVQSLVKRGDFRDRQLPEGKDLEQYIGDLWTTYYELLERYADDALVMLQDDLINPERVESELRRCADYLGLGDSGIGPALATLDLKLVTHRKRQSIDFRSEAEREIHQRFAERVSAQQARFGEKPAAATCLYGDTPKLQPGKYCIYIATPDGYQHSHAFDEQALSLHYAFRRLGYLAPVVRDTWDLSGVPIVLGGNVLSETDRAKLPANSILYNLEQIHAGSPWLKPEYIETLREFRVWDYSPQNVHQLEQLGIDVSGVCEVGYVPELSSIEQRCEEDKDIDVLFYGSINERRQAIIDQLRARGLNVVAAFGVYGLRRDRMIARAKIVLNVHYYESKVLEVVRLSYLLANRCFVVSEKGSDPDTEKYYRDGVAFADYDALTDTCLSYLERPDERLRIAERGLAIQQTRKQEAYLGGLLKQMAEAPPELALVMIARNEAHCIEKALQSARAYVDEMIVVDTGSTDDTRSLAESCGARVYDFAWCDDFAAARNAALAHSNARWNLILDADEWIEASGDVLHKAIRNHQPFIGLVPVASEYDLAGEVEVAKSWMPRLLPRRVRYEGAIHEQPVSDCPRKRIDVDIGHSGYRRTLLDLKKGRNRALLLKMLERNPDDPYFLYQLARDYEVYEEYPEAVDAFIRALEVTPDSVPFRHELVVRLLYCLKQVGQHEVAMEFAESEMPNWQDSPDFFFVLGDLALDLATRDPKKAGQFVPMIETCWKRCLDIGDQPDLEGSVIGRGSHLAAYNLAVMYESFGNAEQAVKYREMASRMKSSGDR